MTETKIKRHYSNEEYVVRRSWGMQWDLILKDIRKHRATALLVAYHFRRLVHCERIPWNMTGLMRLRVIMLRDYSHIAVGIQEVNVEQILLRRLVRMSDSEELMNEARSSMQDVYNVKDDFRLPVLEKAETESVEVPWWNRD